MDIWYTENHTDNVRLSIRIDRQLASVQSEFQRIDVFRFRGVRTHYDSWTVC